MTLAEVQSRVAEVAKLAADDERAHAAEDALHSDVLAAIAHDDAYPSAKAIARAALGTAGLDFARWCA